MKPTAYAYMRLGFHGIRLAPLLSRLLPRGRSKTAWTVCKDRKYCVATMQQVKRSTRRENEWRPTFARTGTRHETIGLDAALEKTGLDTLIAQRGSPGMLVLAPPLRVLHMNDHASKLLRRLPNERKGNGHARQAKGLLPKCVHEICSAIFAMHRARRPARDWKRFEIRRVLGAPERPILIHGFGVPDRNGRRHSRAVLLVEAIGQRKGELNGKTRRRFRFTEREQAVVRCLANGWTNKEIASALTLAVPTVKEHIRHIMAKTNTTTRAGILAQVLRM